MSSPKQRGQKSPVAAAGEAKGTAGSWTSRVAVSLSKAATPKANWDSKDQFLDVVYWQRQLLSAVLGLLWGCLPLTGIIGLLLFLLANCAAVYLFASAFQAVDEEEYGGLGEILKEGLMTSFATFLVLWIIVYDHCHGAA